MGHEKTEDFVTDLLHQRLGVPKQKIKSSSRLFHDLGIDGADAEMLFEILEAECQVDLENLVFDDFFGPEAGCNPVVYLYFLFFKREELKMKPLYVRDIVKVINEKVWPEENFFKGREKEISF